MARQSTDDVDLMQEMMEDEQLDQLEEQEQDRFENLNQMQDAFGAPEPEEKINQHAFLNKAAFMSPDTVRTTFLSESELGRPLFSVRFLLDMHDISKHYIDNMAEELGFSKNKDNKIAIYFWEKVQNITASGMSYKGFTMNLNVTKRMEATRRRFRAPVQQAQGGERNES